MGILDRISRGITLTIDSIHVLRHHPRLMVFPLISAITGILFLGIFLGVTFGAMRIAPEGGVLLVLFLVYLVLTFVTTFFTAGLVHQTRHVLDGGEPTLSAGVDAAWSVKTRLFVWALIAATIGLIINGMENSDSRGSRVLGSIFGVAWTLLTFFIIPVIVFEKTSVKGMFSRSVGTFKQTWGETPISLIGVQLISILVGIPLFFIGFIALSANTVIGIGLILVGVLVAFLVAQTLEGIIKTTLYLYATEGKRPPEFDNVDFDQLAAPESATSSFGGRRGL